MTASLARVGAALRHFARNFLRRGRVERELAEEIDGYLELLIEERVARGLSHDEARRAVLVEVAASSR